jgi:hypothetical protein
LGGIYRALMTVVPKCNFANAKCSATCVGLAYW